MTVTGIALRVGRRARRALFLPRFHPRLRVDRTRGGYITCAGKHDRAGSQALAILSTMVFADRAGLMYVHTPFREMDGTAPEEVDQWEAFFNLGYGELHINDSDSLGLIPGQLPSSADLPFGGSNTLHVVRHCHDYANLFPDEYGRIADRLGGKFAAAPKTGLVSHYDKTKLNVAVHVRRGDVTRDGPFADRFTANEFIKTAIDSVLPVSSSLRRHVSVRLYSDGRAGEFAGLEVPDLHLHLGESPFATFSNLVDADVLIMSKSTFSYVAALLSKGVKIYESFGKTSFDHRPLKHWLRADDNGRVDRGRLERALALLSQRVPHAEEAGHQ